MRIFSRIYSQIILLLLLALAVMNACNNTTTTTKVTTTDSVSTKIVTTTAIVRNTTELPVIPLITADSRLDDDSVDHDFVYPTKDTIDADSMNSQAAAYGAAYEVWLGPKDWTGKGDEGADGNTVAVLYPPGINYSSDSTPHVYYNEIPSCWGCMLFAAAPYFAGAMQEYNENFNKDGKDPLKVPEGLQIHKISATLLTYTIPASHHLVNCGVAYYLPAGEDRDAYYAEAHFVLPENDTKLANFLSKNFIRSKQLK